MVPALLKGLAEEEVVLLSHSKINKLPFGLNGIVRLIDEKGNTLGLVLDKVTLSELEEDTESQHPLFLQSLVASRKSGRVKSSEVKKKAGLV